MTLNRLSWIIDDLTDDSFIRVVTDNKLWAGKLEDCPTILKQRDVRHMNVKSSCGRVLFWFYL